jgi:hypothetical protein
MQPNGGVDAAARFHSSIAGRIKLRNTLPPLASNDLLGCVRGLEPFNFFSVLVLENQNPRTSGYVVERFFRLGTFN